MTFRDSTPSWENPHTSLSCSRSSIRRFQWGLYSGVPNSHAAE